MQISKEISVLKGILNLKNENWLRTYSHFLLIGGHIGFMQMNV